MGPTVFEAAAVEGLDIHSTDGPGGWPGWELCPYVDGMGPSLGDSYALRLDPARLVATDAILKYEGLVAPEGFAGAARLTLTKREVEALKVTDLVADVDVIAVSGPATLRIEVRVER